MTLSKPVEESLRASQEHLRDALAFAARGEKSYVAKHIANFSAQIISSRLTSTPEPISLQIAVNLKRYCVDNIRVIYLYYYLT